MEKIAGNAIEKTKEKSKKFNAKKWGILVGIAAVIAALIVGSGICHTPENRLRRQLDLGNRYLQEQKYGEAALAFEKAITIDERCMAAYTGGLEAYLGKGDAENSKVFYDKTLAMLSGLEADFVIENRDSIVELYLSVEKVYGDNPEKVVEILEDGCQQTGEDERLKDKLIEIYIVIAKEKTEEGVSEEALVIYDRLIELDRENADMIAGLNDCLNRYIEVLVKEGRYDEIRELKEKYGDIATGADFDAALQRALAAGKNVPVGTNPEIVIDNGDGIHSSVVDGMMITASSGNGSKATYYFSNDSFIICPINKNGYMAEVSDKYGMTYVEYEEGAAETLMGMIAEFIQEKPEMKFADYAVQSGNNFVFVITTGGLWDDTQDFSWRWGIVDCEPEDCVYMFLPGYLFDDEEEYLRETVEEMLASVSDNVVMDD